MNSESIRVLVAVKTYPTLSSEYNELVCTAGFREDGSWIRIYPVPFRFLQEKQQYKKWQWIRVKTVKNNKDFRPESYRPYDLENSIQLEDEIPSKNSWKARSEFALKHVWNNMTELAKAAQRDNISLATLKPKEVKNFIWERTSKEWDHKKLEGILSSLNQGFLFDTTSRQGFEIAKKIPFKFSYVFSTEDGKERTMMIEDWELGMLYLKMYNKFRNEEVACEKVKEKYFRTMINGRDLYFFVGTTLKFHKVNVANPFIIIGTYWPPLVKNEELSLFD